MFEKTLSDKLRAIFQVDKVTYAAPGESQEQNCIFIEVVSSKNSIKDTRALAKVTGKITVFASNERLPYGYFSKAIAQADADTTKDLFFYDFELNTRIFQNVAERSVSFVYFFDSQYDPDIGTINSVDIEVTT
jgi:hypothetical protein